METGNWKQVEMEASELVSEIYVPSRGAEEQPRNCLVQVSFACLELVPVSQP